MYRKTCNKCNRSLPITEYHKQCNTKDGLNGSCKRCRKIQQQEYRKTPKGKANDKRYNDSSKRYIALYSYWARYPEKKAAQTILSNSRRDGELIPSEKCQGCGENTKLEGHHWSYEESNWKDVFWLCKSCHEKEHEHIKVHGYPEYKTLYVKIYGFCK